ncbi:hypothetical protein PTTG_25293 [Puccinia triticina 1-1 BBBD Race 1]|uniref:Uncharacterized protein n=1 Tax=Puccinia triticina (isolate 1-1 / race 1 (BBBD)) TaxID=630390 RepID=A0A180H4N4_PUCT1|nr:hypothetical protein PTTG_25293 [Puccinia triticina 1-1 BBBD Race 1]
MCVSAQRIKARTKPNKTVLHRPKSASFALLRSPRTALHRTPHSPPSPKKVKSSFGVRANRPTDPARPLASKHSQLFPLSSLRSSSGTRLRKDCGSSQFPGACGTRRPISANHIFKLQLRFSALLAFLNITQDGGCVFVLRQQGANRRPSTRSLHQASLGSSLSIAS